MARLYSRSLAAIASFFGAPSDLGSLYRGGSYVPDNNANAAVANSGSAISIGAFWGCSTLKATKGSNATGSYSRVGAGSGTATSGVVTCTASGGGGGYTYAWTNTGGVAFTINSPYFYSTSFNYTHAVPGTRDVPTNYVGYFKCTVTDADGILADTLTVTVTLSFTNLSA